MAICLASFLTKPSLARYTLTYFTIINLNSRHGISQFMPLAL